MQPQREEANSEVLKRELNERFRGPLMSFFYRRVGDRAEAEDLTHEVFVRLISASSLSAVENANAFVFKVAANLLRDRQRHAGRWRMHEYPIDEDLVYEVANEFLEHRTPERTVAGRQTLAAVIASLDELGQRTRNIFVLFRLEHMKQREIASLFGISQSTVEKTIMKAVMHLALRHASEVPEDRSGRQP